MILLALATASATASAVPGPLAGVDWPGLGLQAVQVASPVVLALLGWVGVTFRAWLLAKTKSETLARLSDLAFSVAGELEQTTVSAIREANKDGKITEAEKAKIQEAALDTLKSHIGAKGLAEIKTVFGFGPHAVDGFLITLIESGVGALKAR